MLCLRPCQMVNERRVVYEIDGERIQDTDGFYTMVGEAVNGPGGYFGRGLDSLNDCLRGGFGRRRTVPSASLGGTRRGHGSSWATRRRCGNLNVGLLDAVPVIGRVCGRNSPWRSAAKAQRYSMGS